MVPKFYVSFFFFFYIFFFNIKTNRRERFYIEDIIQYKCHLVKLSVASAKLHLEPNLIFQSLKFAIKSIKYTKKVIREHVVIFFPVTAILNILGLDSILRFLFTI